MSRLNPRTSSPTRSIWYPLSENTFREHLVALEKRTNAVPVDPQIFPLTTSAPCTPTLSLHVEQQLADDLAFLAAIEEGAQSVAAVCLEEYISPRRLVVRFAALDLSLSAEVKDALQHIVDLILFPSAPGEETSLPKQSKYEELFSVIVNLHFRRLLARLRSAKWEKPTYLRQQHKKPLWADFPNLSHRVQFVYTKKESALRREVETHIAVLASTYDAFESAPPENNLPALHHLIHTSYSFIKTPEIAAFAERLDRSVTGTPTRQIASALKTLLQVEKIAAYWRITRSLLDTARTYPALFVEKVELAFLTPYASVPTSVAYESWAATCHVHAEVQLAVYYDLRSQNQYQDEGVLRPRVIGTSKWLCYLCYLFLREHGGFRPANTHGRLYDQWTVPDLEEYGGEMRGRYREIVRGIDEEVVRVTLGVEEGVRWRAEPMTSRQNLLGDDNAGVMEREGGEDVSSKLAGLDIKN
ncbi:hypothetical protein BU23DRAFT_485858 [Bimuria novae-zelandiae CBS 107.79]|uniref:Uncharacterized protein n=1 Tax=Bimuria novae-zelandiae CBS 107.79 TaxID=1447943 RepID=A0A6A5UPV5_9PLEO|nr:hypothetical protein BU23DRAFT_485858 [Bimuria novae-zelandiae CBS 107.79]